MVAATVATRESVLEILREVKDPELPMIDVVELGVVRDVTVDSTSVRVDITPTYSGCPAIHVMESEIIATLSFYGFDDVQVRTVHSPAWTTDWMSEETKQKFRDNGIAAPGKRGAAEGIDELVSLRRAQPTSECPFCGSANTVQKSEFGSTACKSIHFCNSCHQPFDQFKTF